jgi:hypothetical protein
MSTMGMGEYGLTDYAVRDNMDVQTHTFARYTRLDKFCAWLDGTRLPTDYGQREPVATWTVRSRDRNTGGSQHDRVQATSPHTTHRLPAFYYYAAITLSGTSVTGVVLWLLHR